MADESEVRAGLSWEDYDILAWKHIKKEWLALERGLFTSKWFDYRFLHPVQATLLYASEFQKAYRAAFAESIDHRAAEHITIVQEDDFFTANKPVKVSGLWRGRQVADAIGMPYNVYTSRALYHARQYWRQRHLPQAQQLYSERIVERVVEDWAERQRSILMFSRLSIYHNQRYLGTQAQNDHHEWLFTQADLRHDPVEWMGEFCQMGLLPADKVRNRFEPETIARIQHILAQS